jgi:hypothetical protein
MQNLFHGIAQIIKLTQALANPAFQTRPAPLNLVEIWRIGRQEQQLASSINNHLFDTPAFVEGGIIQYHHLSNL